MATGNGVVQARDAAILTAMGQIERRFGKGAIMRMGDRELTPLAVIPTGSIALDVALGVGGVPRRRVVEIYGPESSGKTTRAIHIAAEAQKAGGVAIVFQKMNLTWARRLGDRRPALRGRCPSGA
jgi:recombination protein RecA